MAANEELGDQSDHVEHCSRCGNGIKREFVFCSHCGVKVEKRHSSQIVILGGQSFFEREIIESYFHSGFEYEAILQF